MDRVGVLVLILCCPSLLLLYINIGELTGNRSLIDIKIIDWSEVDGELVMEGGSSAPPIEVQLIRNTVTRRNSSPFPLTTLAATEGLGVAGLNRPSSYDYPLWRQEGTRFSYDELPGTPIMRRGDSFSLLLDPMPNSELTSEDWDMIIRNNCRLPSTNFYPNSISLTLSLIPLGVLENDWSMISSLPPLSSTNFYPNGTSLSLSPIPLSVLEEDGAMIRSIRLSRSLRRFLARDLDVIRLYRPRSAYLYSMGGLLESRFIYNNFSSESSVEVTPTIRRRSSRSSFLLHKSRTTSF